MNEMLDIVGFAALSAQVLVTEMVKSGWSGTREIISRVFRRGGQESESRQLALLDQDHESLLSTPAAERAEAGEEAQARWTVLIAALLQQFPEARVDLQEMLDHADQAPDGKAAAASLQALNNMNSQIIQAGGSITTGGGSISYGTASRGE